MKSKKIILSFGMFSVFFLTSCNKTEVVLTEPKLKSVEIRKMEPSIFEEELKFIGRVGSTDETTVSAQLAGELASVSVKVGTKVNAGQEIARINETKSAVGITARNAITSYVQAKNVYEATKKSLEKDLESSRIALNQATLNKNQVDETTKKQEESARIQAELAMANSTNNQETFLSTKKSAEIAVSNAKLAIDNFEKNIEESIKTLEDKKAGIYTSLKVSIEGNIPTLDTVFELVDTTYGISESNKYTNDSIEAALSAKDTSIKKETEVAYQKAFLLYEEYQTKKNYSTATGSELSFEITRNLLNATSQMLTSAILGLNKSVAGNNFPQTQIDALSANFQAKQATFNGLLSSITNQLTAITDINNSIESTKTNKETTLKTLRGAYESAQQAYTTVVSGNITSETSLESARKLAQISLDSTLITTRSNRLSSENALGSAQAAYESALARRDSSLANAQSQIESANSQRLASEVSLRNLSITAPYAGIILKKHVQKGTTVNPGTPIVTLATPDALVTTLEVPNEVAQQFTLGQKAILQKTGESYTGSISLISPSVNEQSGLREVEIQFAPIPTGKKIPEIGMVVDVTIRVQTPKKILSLPISAINPKSNDTYEVMTVGSGNIVYSREVQIGKKNKDSVEITEGLNEGEEVIIRGNLSVGEKEKVVIENLQP